MSLTFFSFYYDISLRYIYKNNNINNNRRAQYSHVLDDNYAALFATNPPQYAGVDWNHEQCQGVRVCVELCWYFDPRSSRNKAWCSKRPRFGGTLPQVKTQWHTRRGHSRALMFHTVHLATMLDDSSSHSLSIYSLHIYSVCKTIKLLWRQRRSNTQG